MTTTADFVAVQNAILRRAIQNEAQIEVGSGTAICDYVERLLERSRTSTIPVLVLTDAVEGKVPSSDRLTTLSNFAERQFEHYASVLKVMNPDLGPFEAVGRFLSGTAGFHEQSAGKSDREFIADVWKKANLGRDDATLSDAIIEHYIAQIGYFISLYQRVCLSESDATNWARGAVFGQIFGAAALDCENQPSESARQFLREAAAGRPKYGLPLSVGTRGR